MVDGSDRAGGGHVNRCLALAKALIPNARVAFDLGPDVSEVWLERLAAESIEMASPEFALQVRIDGIVVDHYGMTSSAIGRLRRPGTVLAVMEDFGANFEDADILIGPTTFEMTESEKPPVRRLRSLEYALINPQFHFDMLRVIPASIRQVLVSFGLRDSAGATLLALEALQKLRWDGFAPHITVALGSTCPHLEAVRHYVAKFQGDAHLLVDSARMPEMVHAADIAIGAGGIGMLERCAAGLPSIVLAINEAQRAAAALAADKVAIWFPGMYSNVSSVDLASLVLSLAASVDDRRMLSENGRRLIDGSGARRVARHLMGVLRTVRGQT